MSSYHPLIIRKDGRIAQAKYNLPPFVDASCRREPDLEHAYPSISGLCHGKMFAPRLKTNDIAVFITVQGRYLDEQEPHWRLTAILSIYKEFQTHKQAAEWYLSQGLGLPSNCWVPGNGPLPLDMTVGHYRGADKKMHKAARVEDWDAGYKVRARKYPKFLACKILYRELNEPPVLTIEDAKSVFDKGRMLMTRTPPRISQSEYERLKHACGID